MSRHNYTQYSKNNENTEISPEIEAELKTSITEAEETNEPTTTVATPDPIPEPEPQPEPVFGTVANCTKLNIRKNPAAGATVVCVLDAGTKLEIDVTRSTSDWFKVSTVSGVDGYCMRKFIKATL